jgi:predicted permease
MGIFWQDLRYTIRALATNRAFTAVALLSLALGIGANTAIFTLINALLLRNLPVRKPQQLVELSAIRRNDKTPFSFPMFREVERGQRVFSGLIGWGGGALVNVEVNGVLSQNHVLTATGNYYSELGVAPLLGRLLTPEDANPQGGATSQVAVLGYEFWRQRFNAVSDVVGKQIRIEGQPFTVIGVTRRWFTGMTTGWPPEVTIPITAEPLMQGGGAFHLDDRSVLWLSVTGRLRDGVTIAQARAQLQSFWPEVLLAAAPTETPGPRRQAFLSMGLDVEPAKTGVARNFRSQFTRPLYLLMSIVGLILLVACVNLANLMLARAASRNHEMSVRVALGANGLALARQVLTESLVLSFAGALLGLGFAYWGSSWLVTLMTEGYLVSFTFDLGPDPRVLSLTVSLALLTGILFGLVPAWRASREDPASVLQENNRSPTGSASGLGKALIVTQIALSFVLLLCAGLLVRSFQKLRSIDLGFQKESLLEVSLNPKPSGYQNLDMNNYLTHLLARVSGIPGVRSVSFSDYAIPSPGAYRGPASVVSSDASTGINVMTTDLMVSPSFLGTLGIELVRGRGFDETDDERHPPVAIISNSLAKSLFPCGDALGKRIRFDVMPAFQNLEVVGVAGDARLFDLRDSAAPILYLPVLQHPDWAQFGHLFMRTDEAPEAVARTVSHEIDSLGHEYSLSMKTVAQVTGQVRAPERVIATLSCFFAALALLLASIGLYGLMSYAVTRRTREIAIRVALGAQRDDILRAVLRETLTLGLLGMAIGIPCALGVGRLVASMLFGVSSNDLPTIASVSLLLLVVAGIAGYLPARRATAIDPLVALRAE